MHMQPLSQPTHSTQPVACSEATRSSVSSGTGIILSNSTAGSPEPLLVLGHAHACGMHGADDRHASRDRSSATSATLSQYVFGSPTIRHPSAPLMNASDQFELEPLPQFTRRAYIFRPDDDPLDPQQAQQGDYHDPWHLAPKSAPASTRSSSSRCLPFLHDTSIVSASAPSLTRVSPLRRLLGFTQSQSTTTRTSSTARTPKCDDGNAHGKRARGCLADAILKGIGAVAAGRLLEPNETAKTPFSQ